MKCPHCGTDLQVWQEVFGEPHHCPGPASDEVVVKLLGILRQHGIPCFTTTDLTTPELEDQIKGEG